RRALLGARGARRPPRPALAGGAAAPAPARPASRRGPARQAGRGDPLLRLHDQPGRERGPGGRGPAPRAAPPRRAAAAPSPPPRPESLLTLPPVHHTSGFFIARLTP